MSTASTTIATLAGSSAAVGVTAAAGALVTDPESSWYRNLDLPSWQPPGSVFPIVWTPLYASIAGASTVVISRLDRAERPAERSAFKRALAVNLVLNAGWSAVFFGLKRTGPAAAVAAVLAVSSIDLARRAGAVGPGPRAALAPYAAWTTFASVLSTTIWRRNR